MRDGSTRPIELEGAPKDLKRLWQPDDMAWSFDPNRRRLVGWLEDFPSEMVDRPSGNDVGPTTVGPQKVTGPKGKPIALRGSDFGRRALQPLSHWEGVVEEVTNGVFRCRLTQLVDGKPDPSRIEFTDFSLEDLADESDQSFVEPGAIFYWTLGRARNTAGTVTNVSLVRFRRLPPPNRRRLAEAEREAEELLRALDGNNGSNPS